MPGFAGRANLSYSPEIERVKFAGVRRGARGVASAVLASVGCLLTPAALRAQDVPAPTITQVVVEREGRVVTDPFILSLLETTPGEPLSMRDVRETIAHLIGLDAFEDVRVLQEKAPSGGVLIRYVLVPAHPIDRVEFEGALRVDEDDLRRLVVDELGPTPRAAQAGGATEALKRALRDRGYPQAEVVARVQETHNPDRATLVFAVNAGRASRDRGPAHHARRRRRRRSVGRESQSPARRAVRPGRCGSGAAAVDRSAARPRLLRGPRQSRRAVRARCASSASR